MGRLGPLPTTSHRITKSWRPPRRREHCQYSRPMGSGPSIRRCRARRYVKFPFVCVFFPLLDRLSHVFCFSSSNDNIARLHRQPSRSHSALSAPLAHNLKRLLITTTITKTQGTRLGVSEHPEDNLNVFRFRLSDSDRADIEAVLERSNGRKMITLIGDCGAEYR